MPKSALIRARELRCVFQSQPESNFDATVARLGALYEDLRIELYDVAEKLRVGGRVERQVGLHAKEFSKRKTPRRRDELRRITCLLYDSSLAREPMRHQTPT
jgi:hypothetical protein